VALYTRQLLLGPLEEALDQAPAMRALLEPLRSDALGALEAHTGWLRDRLEAGLAVRDPRLGPEKYAAKLWATLDAHITPDDLLARAEDDLARIEGDIARAAAAYLGEEVPPPDDAGALVRRALDAVAAEGPVDDTTVLALCTAAMATTTNPIGLSSAPSAVTAIPSTISIGPNAATSPTTPMITSCVCGSICVPMGPPNFTFGISRVVTK
jgi:hypothetical protein